MGEDEEPCDGLASLRNATVPGGVYPLFGGNSGMPGRLSVLAAGD